MTKWSQLEIVKAGHFDVGFRIDCMATTLSGLGGLWSMYEEAGHFAVGFRVRCMATQLGGLDGLWSMYLKAGHFDVGFRLRCMATWSSSHVDLLFVSIATRRSVYVCGSWSLRRELPFAVWPHGHLATWTFRLGMSCYCSVDEIVQLFWQA